MEIGGYQDVWEGVDVASNLYNIGNSGSDQDNYNESLGDRKDDIENSCGDLSWGQKHYIIHSRPIQFQDLKGCTRDMEYRVLSILQL